MMKKWLLVLQVLVLSFVLTGCASAAPLNTASEEAEGMMIAPAAPAVPMMPAQEAVPMPAADESFDTTSPKNAAAIERIVIKNAELSIVVDDPVSTLDSIIQLSETKGGYVVTSQVYKVKVDDGLEVPKAAITVRVPAEQLNDVLEQIKGYVKDKENDILRENVSGQDVTQEYTDTQSRLKNLEQTEAQLREVMKSASKTEDILATMDKLNQITEQIEVLKGQIQYYDTSAKYSAVSVEISSTEAIKPLTVGGWQPVGIARDALQALINMLKLLANILIWVVIFFVPLAIVLLLPLWVIWLIFRRWQKNKKAKNTVTASPQEPHKQ